MDTQFSVLTDIKNTHVGGKRERERERERNWERGRK